MSMVKDTEALPEAKCLARLRAGVARLNGVQGVPKWTYHTSRRTIRERITRMTFGSARSRHAPRERATTLKPLVEAGRREAGAAGVELEDVAAAGRGAPADPAGEQAPAAARRLRAGKERR